MATRTASGRRGLAIVGAIVGLVFVTLGGGGAYAATRKHSPTPTSTRAANATPTATATQQASPTPTPASCLNLTAPAPNEAPSLFQYTHTTRSLPPKSFETLV